MSAADWIGYTSPPSVLHLEPTRMRFFAKAIGEDRPLYVDEAAAQAAGLPGLLAPPTWPFSAEMDSGQTDAVLAKLGIPFERLLHGEQGFVHHRPVYAGDTLTVRSRIKDVYSKKQGAMELVVKTSTVHNQHQDLVAEMRAVVVHLRDGTPSQPPPATPLPPWSGPLADLTAPEVGALLPSLTQPPLSRLTLALFAGASGDHNPIHVDLDFARHAGQPDVFAHGMLGMAWVGRLLTGWAPPSQLQRWQLRFMGLTRVGDVVQSQGRITAVEPCGSQKRVRVEVRHLNQDQQVLMAGEAEFLT